MDLRDKIKIFNNCNELFGKYELEHKDCLFIENCFGDEVMEIVGKKYGLSIIEVEEIYEHVQMLFIEAAVNKLLSINKPLSKRLN